MQIPVLTTAENDPEIQAILDLPDDDRETFFRSLSDEEARALLYDWQLWARPKQLAPPGRWRIWLLLSGRGFGKSRAGAEWVQAKARSSSTGRGALIGATFNDVRETMIEGESGILSIADPEFRPRLRWGRKLLEWPNGAQAHLYSAEKPNRLRGPQHEWIWADEIAAYQYPKEVHDQAMFGLRIGPNPQAVFTTTPKPIPLLFDLTKDAVSCTDLRGATLNAALLTTPVRVVVTEGTSYENRANLSESWYSEVIGQYQGTTLGDQEVLGKLLRDIEGALWKQSTIETTRLLAGAKIPPLVRIVVAVDPSGGAKKAAAEAGIVVAGKAANGHAYVLADKSGRMEPAGWGKAAFILLAYWIAYRIVGENNFGGDMVRNFVRNVNPNAPYKDVHASRGKIVRAEPIAALYEQGRVHHVGTFGMLESQMTTYVPDAGLASPDRMDALVWALTDLMGKSGVFVV